MHEVKVQVVGTELLQGVLDSELDVLRVVVDLEELGGDEELLTGDTGSSDTLSDLSLVLVTPSTAVWSVIARFPDVGWIDVEPGIIQFVVTHSMCR